MFVQSKQKIQEPMAIFLIQAKLKSKKIRQSQILFAKIELQNTAFLTKKIFQQNSRQIGIQIIGRFFGFFLS